ncbi:PTS lichenan-specific IIA component domain protein [Mycoplasmoides gallisepticum str. F]|uniref:PTS lichenan-specific IIA component domain protein n=1 Tax=Mycoplasmoides gallisepticum TaxID=2096 RepID=UPI0001C39941|nr:PTS lichenan-specific IIA component domain protein [Mycoplasmoides gallisepticum]ADC31513.1 PTS lichenan-specific IIA component domain protein [Mycoplasmoides gallisepticum str. F]
MKKFVRWEFIANNKFKFNDSIIKEVANNLKQLHSSDLKFQENFMHKRLEAFLENIKKLDRLNDIVQKKVEYYYLIDLKNSDLSTPIHNDLYFSNILLTDEEKVYLLIENMLQWVINILT